MWLEETFHLTKLDQFNGERIWEEKGKGEEEKRREKLLLLSSVPGDPTVGFRRSKRQSSFSRRELRVGTRIGEFRQTPRGRGFSYSVYS